MISGFNSNAQNNSKIQQQFEKALQYYNLQEYETAISEIEKLLKKNPGYTDAILLLSDIYHDLQMSGKEIEALENAMQYSKNPLIFFRLASAYYFEGSYEKALFNFEKYLQSNGISDTRRAEVNRKILSCRFSINALKNPVDYIPVRLSENINTENDEYWPSVSLDGNKLVFTRLQKLPIGLKQEDFFISERDSSGWGKATPISEINTMDNEGAQTLSADGRLLFFTACNRPDGNGSCDIYYSVFNGKTWSSPKNAGSVVNSSGWDAQPTLSSDNRYLFFSSNRAGGNGKKDIWQAELLEIQENGNLKWGIPKNVGLILNTQGDEISPFIHPNNKSFYFASDFHTGMGGMDLFQSEIKLDGTFTEPTNMGFPINTSGNEQGLNISSDGKTAYFASERVPGFGLDIFTFQLPEELRPEPVTYVKAKIIDSESGEIIRAVVDLVNLSADSVIHRIEKADEKGEVLICLPINANYAFNVSEPGYLFYSQSFQLKEMNTLERPEEISIGLNKIEPGAEMNLYNIYFETDSFNILPESEPELEKLTSFLKNNPQLEVEIQGHTDNTGSQDKNIILSELRAKSVFQYLVLKGISSKGLKFKGYGETQPVATNKTEEGRIMNRRTTIKIIE